jgi:hypothetical protein
MNWTWAKLRQRIIPQWTFARLAQVTGIPFQNGRPDRVEPGRLIAHTLLAREPSTVALDKEALFQQDRGAFPGIAAGKDVTPAAIVEKVAGLGRSCPAAMAFETLAKRSSGSVTGQILPLAGIPPAQSRLSAPARNSTGRAAPDMTAGRSACADQAPCGPPEHLADPLRKRPCGVPHGVPRRQDEREAKRGLP